MNNTHLSLVLQGIAIFFLILLAYLNLNSQFEWKSVGKELQMIRTTIRVTTDSLLASKNKLKKRTTALKKIQIQKDILRSERDSILFDFKRKNAKDWKELSEINDTLSKIHTRIQADMLLLDKIFDNSNHRN